MEICIGDNKCFILVLTHLHRCVQALFILKTLPRPPRLPGSQRIPGLLGNYSHPSFLYFSPLQDEKLLTLMNDIQDYATKLPSDTPPYQPAIGDLCLAKFTGELFNLLSQSLQSHRTCPSMIHIITIILIIILIIIITVFIMRLLPKDTKHQVLLLQGVGRILRYKT